MAELPIRTVTLLFAAIKSSTRLLQQLSSRCAELPAGYRRLLGDVVQLGERTAQRGCCRLRSARPSQQVRSAPYPVCSSAPVPSTKHAGKLCSVRFPPMHRWAWRLEARVRGSTTRNAKRIGVRGPPSRLAVRCP